MNIDRATDPKTANMIYCVGLKLREGVTGAAAIAGAVGTSKRAKATRARRKTKKK